MSKSLEPDKAPHFVGPVQSQNCLQRLSADGTRRQIVKNKLDLPSKEITSYQR